MKNPDSASAFRALVRDELLVVLEQHEARSLDDETDRDVVIEALVDALERGELGHIVCEVRTMKSDRQTPHTRANRPRTKGPKAIGNDAPPPRGGGEGSVEALPPRVPHAIPRFART